MIRCAAALESARYAAGNNCHRHAPEFLRGELLRVEGQALSPAVYHQHCRHRSAAQRFLVGQHFRAAGSPSHSGRRSQLGDGFQPYLQHGKIPRSGTDKADNHQRPGQRRQRQLGHSMSKAKRPRTPPQKPTSGILVRSRRQSGARQRRQKRSWLRICRAAVRLFGVGLPMTAPAMNGGGSQIYEQGEPQA